MYSQVKIVLISLLSLTSLLQCLCYFYPAALPAFRVITLLLTQNNRYTMPYTLFLHVTFAAIFPSHSKVC